LREVKQRAEQYQNQKPTGDANPAETNAASPPKPALPTRRGWKLYIQGLGGTERNRCT
jgi:hypothetical protein